MLFAAGPGKTLGFAAFACRDAQGLAARWRAFAKAQPASTTMAMRPATGRGSGTGAVDGERLRRVFQEQALAEGKSMDEITAMALAHPSLKYLVDADAIAGPAVFPASDAARSISGRIFPIDGDMQRN